MWLPTCWQHGSPSANHDSNSNRKGLLSFLVIIAFLEWLTEWASRYFCLLSAILCTDICPAVCVIKVYVCVCVMWGGEGGHVFTPLLCLSIKSYLTGLLWYSPTLVIILSLICLILVLVVWHMLTYFWPRRCWLWVCNCELPIDWRWEGSWWSSL